MNHCLTSVRKHHEATSSRIVSLAPYPDPVSQGADIAPANAGSKRTWNFESNEPGKIARGFTSEVGNWEIVIEGGNNVLAGKPETTTTHIMCCSSTAAITRTWI